MKIKFHFIAERNDLLRKHCYIAKDKPSAEMHNVLLHAVGVKGGWR